MYRLATIRFVTDRRQTDRRQYHFNITLHYMYITYESRLYGSYANYNVK